MSSENENRNYLATVARLDERINTVHRILDEREKQVANAFITAAKATDKAEDAQQRVNATQNEFRGALKDQAATLATKEDLERLVNRVNKIENIINEGHGRSVGLSAAQSLMLTVLALAVAVISVFWKR